MSQRRNQKGNKNYLKTNENGNTTCQNFWNAAKAALTVMFIAANAYIEKMKISNEQLNFTPQGTRKRTN